MNAKEMTICWTPEHGPLAEAHPETAGRMRLIKHPAMSQADAYAYTDLAGWGYVRDLSPVQLSHLVLSIALGAILRDGLDPQEVHRALWPLDAYREALPEDTPSPDDSAALP